jgi:hypothetical protein
MVTAVVAVRGNTVYTVILLGIKGEEASGGMVFRWESQVMDEESTGGMEFCLESLSHGR